MPDIIFESLDKVPEGLREHAKQVEGGEGKVAVNVVAKVKLDEFRDNNVKLAQERDDLKKLVSRATEIIGEDFEAGATEIETVRGVAKRVKDGELVENKGLEEALAERTRSMREGYEGQIKTVTSELQAWKQKASTADQRWKRGIVERSVTDAALDEKLGVNPKALPDIISRAHGVFHVDDSDKLIPKSGDAIVYGADGTTPMTVSEWLGKLRDEVPFMFKGSGGGGAPGSGDTKFGGLTKQDFDKLSGKQKLELANKVPNRAA